MSKGMLATFEGGGPWDGEERYLATPERFFFIAIDPFTPAEVVERPIPMNIARPLCHVYELARYEAQPRATGLAYRYRGVEHG